ncbi:hypothetical protein [Streptococcus acidominimus]|uniref:Uncharacterized protein n=1 Tax=Streptococcus acidominimus TaxID=1326 RepID=A0A1Q8EFR8_STRAI|nr:hypothetical protein [Streptococcus acidominimus]OLF50650.1 hypothetical protein BU200_01110 [Streptococcus acidominimus]SUN05086.1 Uncharacterised protein [Streptococcus acidominimus]
MNEQSLKKRVLSYWFWRNMSFKNDKEALKFISEKQEAFLRRFDSIPSSRDEWLELPPGVQYQAYDLGLLVSREYTPEELEERKQYYLSLTPLPSSNLSKKAWQWHVERQYSAASFSDYPDKHFLELDTIRRIGTPL